MRVERNGFLSCYLFLSLQFCLSFFAVIIFFFRKEMKREKNLKIRKPAKLYVNGYNGYACLSTFWDKQLILQQTKTETKRTERKRKSPISRYSIY